MGAKLANATTRPGSGNGWFRTRIRKKFLEKAQGKILRFDFPAIAGEDAHSVNVKIGSHVAFSVGSKDPDVIHERIAYANAQLAKFLRQVMAGELSLDDSVIQSYARSVYEFSLKEYSDKTGLPSMQKTHAAYMNIEHKRVVKLEPIWKQWQHQCGEFDISNELHPISFAEDDFSIEAMNYRVGLLINWWLAENDIEITSVERTRLVRATDAYARNVIEGSTINVSNSHIQATAKARSGQPATKRWTLTEIFDQWVLYKAENKDTVRKWRKVIVRLIKFLGHEIASDVTKLDMQKWRDKIENSDRSMNSVNGEDIPATKRLFSYGFEMELIEKNVAAHLSYVKKAKKLPDKMGYTTDEVVKIVNDAKLNTSPDLRWIPVLAASVGARVSEVAQIHESQIKQDKLNSTIWTVQIEKSKDGQSVKNDGSVRTVPLHPKLFGDEFLVFVTARKGKFLFSDREYDPDRKTPHFSSTINKSRRWIRSLGIDHANKSPHHAFRHWWKGQAESKKDVNLDLVEYIQGHSGARKKSNRMYNKNPSQEECLKVVEAVFAGLDIE